MFLHFFTVKSLQKEQNDPQSAGINMQSPQSESTPKGQLISKAIYGIPDSSKK